MRVGLILPAGDELRWAAAAERHGLFGVVVGGARGEECCIAATLAPHTEALRLIVQLHVGNDHPLTLAEEIAVLDNLSNGRVVVLADVSALSRDAAREDIDLLRRGLSSRPIRHRGDRWTVPAGLPEHDAPDAVMVTPQPAQVQVPIWVTGLEGGPPWDDRISSLAAQTDAVRSDAFCQPAAATLSGRLTEDIDLLRSWAEAGASHLLVHPANGWEPDDLAVVSRHLAPEVGMVGFPAVIASAPQPMTWPAN